MDDMQSGSASKKATLTVCRPIVLIVVIGLPSVVMCRLEALLVTYEWWVKLTLAPVVGCILGVIVGFALLCLTKRLKCRAKLKEKLGSVKQPMIVGALFTFGIATLLVAILTLPEVTEFIGGVGRTIQVLLTIFVMLTGICWAIRTANTYQRDVAEMNMKTSVFKRETTKIVESWARSYAYYLGESIRLSFMTLYLLLGTASLGILMLFLEVGVLRDNVGLWAKELMFILFVISVVYAFISYLLDGCKCCLASWFSNVSVQLCDMSAVLSVHDLGWSQDTWQQVSTGHTYALIHSIICKKESESVLGKTTSAIWQLREMPSKQSIGQEYVLYVG